MNVRYHIAILWTILPADRDNLCVGIIRYYTQRMQQNQHVTQRFSALPIFFKQGTR